MTHRPKLAAFPKAYLEELCSPAGMTLREWIDIAASLDIPGLEFYSGLQEVQDPTNWPVVRRMAEDSGMTIAMLCCSPDFTHPDPEFRQRQIDLERRHIDMAAALGAQYCRVLSGQRRADVSHEEGIRYAAESIIACLDHAAAANVILNLENHYKDNFWDAPEFAQAIDVFCELVDRIESPHFGVNYDPSNAYLAGDEPIELLDRVLGRVVSMHASDRYLIEGTLEDLRREEDCQGYAARLRHGEIGCGLNDYDAIFSRLAAAGFAGWISIEDGVDGDDQLRRSVEFLKSKINEHWP